jgi:hypothetical protein
MKANTILIRCISAVSLLVGIVFASIFGASSDESTFQYALLGFLIGFPITWLIYFSFWFIVKGISRTAFPRQSEQFINMLVGRFGITFTDDQRKLLIEMTGTLMMVAIALVLVGTSFVIVSGLLFLAGRLSW